MFNIRHPSLPNPMNHQLASKAKFDTTEEVVLERCYEEEEWTPQLYAILNQTPASAIPEAMWAWVDREKRERPRRAMVATKVWAVVAAQNGGSVQVFRALEWEYNVMSSLDREIDGPSSK